MRSRTGYEPFPAVLFQCTKHDCAPHHKQGSSIPIVICCTVPCVCCIRVIPHRYTLYDEYIVRNIHAEREREMERERERWRERERKKERERERRVAICSSFHTWAARWSFDRQNDTPSPRVFLLRVLESNFPGDSL